MAPSERATAAAAAAIGAVSVLVVAAIRPAPRPGAPAAATAATAKAAGVPPALPSQPPEAAAAVLPAGGWDAFVNGTAARALAAGRPRRGGAGTARAWGAAWGATSASAAAATATARCAASAVPGTCEVVWTDPPLPSPPPPPPFPGAPPDLASSPPAGRFGMLSEWSQLPKKQFRTLHPAACWKKQAPIPDTPAVRSLRNTHWEVYLQWGSRFAALPFCPPQPVLPWRGRPTSSPDARLPVVDVCATLAANEHPFVLEWTAHHLLLGVRRLNIYPVNREQRAVLERTLGDYARPGGPVWVHPTESDLSQEWIATGGRHVSIERRNIAHCFRERLAGSDIVLHIDLDEYVFPGVYPDVPSLFAAELAAHPKDEVAFCVRYLGYGPDPPTERFPNGTMYLSQLTHSGTFCSNSKTGGVSDCVKKPKVKVRRHFVHELPLKAGCRSDGDMIGALLKKVAPKPCCRATYFVAHLQQRDFWFDSVVRRRRELSDKGAREAALSGFRQWHGAAYLSDTRMRAYGAAAEAALRKGCWRAGWQGPCPVPLPPMQPPV
eukprot:TRINITY_DN3221_c1_g1_i1.p1 TRINITY_DN3221_c1_g1~~TRINITY_DN3221_c1_g1_i1.p1  ORF type:complete len:550 (+),score=135.57 TRINITY_DN3221_c1_g1_i1:131-1780(+)